MPTSDDLNWDDLRFLLRAATAKTLAGAARATGVEHTTIGRRLSALERALGAPVMHRGPDGLQLTPLGERILPLAEDVERSVRAICEVAAQKQAWVRLAVPSGFTQLFTAKIGQLREEHPELSLELVSGSRPVDLKKGEADLALRSGPPADPDLIVRKLCDAGWSLYASKAYLKKRPAPKDPNDLRGHEVIGYDSTLAGVPAAKWIEERVPKASIVLRSREMTDMVAAAISGIGLAVLPCMFGDVEPALERLTPEVLATRSLSLVYRREARVSQSLRAVVRFVVEVIEENAARIRGRP
jgi:DNA-binding transcriptional LysR family regulator